MLVKKMSMRDITRQLDMQRRKTNEERERDKYRKRRERGRKPCKDIARHNERKRDKKIN